MHHHESSHPGYQRFPDTQFSAVNALKSDQAELRSRGFDRIVGAYWRPVYKYLRVKYRQGTDDAQDLTQAFFTRAYDKDYLVAFDRTQGRFRTFLRTCLDRFVANEFKAAGRLKRGGGDVPLSLDFDSAERELQATGSSSGSIDDYFDREWVRSVLSQAIETLRETTANQGKTIRYAIFDEYDLRRDESEEPPSYRQLAEKHNIAVTDVTNYLADMRRQFRVIVLDIIRELTTSDDEFREEVRAVLGVRLS